MRSTPIYNKTLIGVTFETFYGIVKVTRVTMASVFFIKPDGTERFHSHVRVNGFIRMKLWKQIIKT